MARGSQRPTGAAFAALPVAVDAMGGDKAPSEIVAGARAVAADRGIAVVLVGKPGGMGDSGSAWLAKSEPMSSINTFTFTSADRCLSRLAILTA